MLVASAVFLIAHPAHATGGRANYVEIAAWDTGYQAQYTVTNDGPGPLTRWTVVFDLPSGSRLSSSWDSVLSGSGRHLVFDNAAWNGELAPGVSTTFGFVVVGLGRPTGCTINGGPCDTLAPLAAARPRGGVDEVLAARDAPSAEGHGRRPLSVGRIDGRPARRTRLTRRASLTTRYLTPISRVVPSRR